MNEETRYLIQMLVGIDFMISHTQRFIEQYPDDKALQFSLMTCRQFRQNLLDRIERSRLAIPIATRYKAGAVYHLAHAPWLGAFEEELAGFPNGAHDDQVDTAAYAAIILAQLEEERAKVDEAQYRDRK